MDKERTATRSRLADVDNEITNDAPLNVFRENYRILSFSYLFSFFRLFFFVCFSLVDETIVHSVGWSFVNTKTGKRNVQLVDGNG